LRKAPIAFVLLIALSAPCRAADSRLAQKVTYQGGYKRLHAIAEELTKQTGVTIRAGINKQDWRVRDIPVIVCVKDMPLGKLLERIAQCTHVRLVAEKIAGAADDTPTYRLCRNKSREDDIQAQLDALAQANCKLAFWAWDTLVAYANMPDASADIPTTKPYGWIEIDAQRIRALGQALAALGPEGRAKAMTGEQVVVRISKSPVFNAIYDYALKHPQTPAGASAGGPAPEPTPREREQALLALKIMRQDEPDVTGGFMCLVYGITDDSHQGLGSWVAAPVQSAEALADVKKLKLPPPPDVDAALLSDVKFPDPRFKLLKTDDDWNAPELQEKIKLELPQTQRKYFTRAEIFTALAKAASVDIICEDFVSQKLVNHWSVPIDPKSETAAAFMLKRIARMKDTNWFANSDSKLIVGWAANWRKQHQSLVAESLLQGIHDRMEGNGAEIDDLMPFWDLTRDQRSEWVTKTPDFAGLECDWDADMWRVYSALSADDKALAKSPAGLPLAKLDATCLIDFLKRTREESVSHTVTMAIPDESPTDKERNRYLSDPDMVGRLVLKVWSEPMKSWHTRAVDENGFSNSGQYTPGPNGPNKHSYFISITDPKVTEDKLHMRAEWQGAAFPMFTLEREAELVKKAESNAAENN